MLAKCSKHHENSQFVTYAIRKITTLKYIKTFTDQNSHYLEHTIFKSWHKDLDVKYETDIEFELLESTRSIPKDHS